MFWGLKFAPYVNYVQSGSVRRCPNSGLLSRRRSDSRDQPGLPIRATRGDCRDGSRRGSGSFELLFPGDSALRDGGALSCVAEPNDRGGDGREEGETGSAQRLQDPLNGRIRYSITASEAVFYVLLILFSVYAPTRHLIPHSDWLFAPLLLHAELYHQFRIAGPVLEQ